LANHQGHLRKKEYKEFFTVSEALFGSGMRLSNTPEEYSLMYGQSEHSKECGAKQV
jgi:hypothetical protein